MIWHQSLSRNALHQSYLLWLQLLCNSTIRGLFLHSIFHELQLAQSKPLRERNLETIEAERHQLTVRIPLHVFHNQLVLRKPGLQTSRFDPPASFIVEGIPSRQRPYAASNVCVCFITKYYSWMYSDHWSFFHFWEGGQYFDPISIFYDNQCNNSRGDLGDFPAKTATLTTTWYIILCMVQNWKKLGYPTKHLWNKCTDKIVAKAKILVVIGEYKQPIHRLGHPENKYLQYANTCFKG